MWHVAPATSGLKDVQDAADHTAIVYSWLARLATRKMRLDRPPSVIGQPEQMRHSGPLSSVRLKENNIIREKSTPCMSSQPRGVNLYHWSWMHVLTQATLLLQEDDFSSANQRYILEEVVRYLRHESVGVSSFDRMNPEWKDLVLKVQSGAPLSKTAPEVENSVAAWHQEQRDLCLLLSRKLSRNVGLKLSRAHQHDQARRLKEDSEKLVQNRSLSCVIDVPDAAAPITIGADLHGRTISCAIRLQAPSD